MPSKPCCCADTCRITSDAFNRADSTSLGASWDEVAGDWSISSNVLRITASNALARHQTDQPDGTFDIRVTADVKGDDDGDQLRVYILWGDDDGLYAELTIDDADCGSLALYRLAAGVATQIGGTANVTGAGSDTFHTLCICYRESPTPHVTAKVTTGDGDFWVGAYEDVTTETPDATGITGGLGTGTITAGASFESFLVDTTRSSPDHEACPLCRPPCELLSDTFDGASLDCNWSVLSGSWSLTSSVLTADTAGTIKCLVPTPLPPYAYVSVTLSNDADDDIFRILMDFVDTNNYIYGELKVQTSTGTTGYIRLVQVTGGVETELDKKVFREDQTCQDSMIMCLGPDGVYLVAGGTSGGIFAEVTPAGGAHVAIYAGTNGTGFASFTLKLPYSTVADACDPCSTTECECTVCPDVNPPRFMEVDLTDLPWRSGCCADDHPDSVVANECGYYPNAEDPFLPSSWKITSCSYAWPAAFGGTPDAECCWVAPIGGFCSTPLVALLYVFITERSGVKYVEVVYKGTGASLGNDLHGSTALVGDCADIASLEIAMTDLNAGTPNCLDSDYVTDRTVSVTAHMDEPP